MVAKSPLEARSERLGTLVSLVLVGLLSSLLVPMPARQITLEALGSPLAVNFSGAVQLVVVLGALASAGIDLALRADQRLAARSLWYTSAFWPLPALVAVGGLLAIHAVASRSAQVLLIAATGVALVEVALAQYRSVDSQPSSRRAMLLLKVSVYLLGLVLLTALYEAQLRSLLSASGVLLLSTGLSLELYRHTEERAGRIWLYALLTGLAMGELTWGLNYTRFSGRAGGALLLLAFYVVTGLAQQHLWARLTRRVIIEYAVMAVAGLALVALTF